MTSAAIPALNDMPQASEIALLRCGLSAGRKIYLMRLPKLMEKTSAICMLHVFVFEDERDEMYKKEMLAKTYEAQLETERAAAQAKSLFFSAVSHDIRTPLNAIVGFSELLEQGVDDADERARCITSIRSSGKVLARLVDDILDLSKLESGKLEIIEEPTDMPTLVRDVIAACELARSQKSLTLNSEIDEMPWVSIDPQRIRQILFNLQIGRAHV